MEHDKLIQTVTAAQKGDSEALNELFNAFYNDVYYFALKTVKDEELACDITQETFVEIINTLGNLQAPGAFVTWMKQIAYHQCTRYFKKKKDVLVDEDEEGNSIFDTLAEERTEFIPDAAMDQADFRKTILDMIDQLSEEQRSAVMMLYFDELSVKQIAEIQGVSEGTVKSRLNYARKAIKASVETYEKKNGIKLHSVAILPLLLWLFRDAATTMPAAAATSVAAGVTAATGAAVTVGAGAAATATAATAAATTAAAATAAKAAAVPLVAKIAAGIVAAAVTVGGAAVGITSLIDNDPTDPGETYSAESGQPQTPAAYTVAEGCVYIDADGVVYEEGSLMPAPRRGDEYRTPDYTYKLGCSLVRQVVSNPTIPPWELGWAGANEIEFIWEERPEFGWGAICNDNTIPVAANIEPTVNGLPLTYMGCAFFSCEFLTETPVIPDTVIDMRQAFYGCENLQLVSNFPSMLEDLSLAFTHCLSLTEVPQLPSGVTDMFAAFAYCWSLETAPDIPASVTRLAQCFDGCQSLTGTIRIDASLAEPHECNMQCPICGGFDYGCRLCFLCDSTAMCFENTTQSIVLTGECPYLQRLADSSANGNVTVDGGSASATGWIVPAGCTYTRGDTTYTAGQTVPDGYQSEDTFTDGTYLYTFNHYGIVLPNSSAVTDHLGWDVKVLDTSSTQYAPIMSPINGMPVVTLYSTFENCANMTRAPEIPDTVGFMWATFRNCAALQEAPALPEGLFSMSGVFEGCTSLTAAPRIPSTVLEMSNAFLGCNNLVTPSAFPEGVVEISGAYQNTAITAAPEIPDSVQFARCTFSGSKLTSAPVLPANVRTAEHIFSHCRHLTGEVVIHAELKPYYLDQDMLNLFFDTTLPITLSGNSTQLAEIAGKYENVTVK